MMAIEHIGIYVDNLEAVKRFFVSYFGAVSSELYHNRTTGFMSYFLSFGKGCRVEVMTRPGLVSEDGGNFVHGYSHLALTVGGRTEVDSLSSRLKADGFTLLGGPRMTGDGYYECCIDGPEHILIEIMAEY